jgi:CBS domain-containing protein
LHGLAVWPRAAGAVTMRGQQPSNRRTGKVPMATQTTIESVMTPYPYSIEIDAQAVTARTMMEQLRIQHLPVRDEERFVGVVTQRVLHMAEHCGFDFSIGSNVRVRDVYTTDVHTVTVGDLLRDVLMTMAERHLDVTLVLRDGHLAGIFTVTDACRQYAKLLGGR